MNAENQKYLTPFNRCDFDCTSDDPRGTRVFSDHSRYYREDAGVNYIESKSEYFKTAKQTTQLEFDSLCRKLSQLHVELNRYIEDAESFSDIDPYIEYLSLAYLVVQEAKLVAKQISQFEQSEGIIHGIREDIIDMESTLLRMIDYAEDYKRFVAK